MNLVDGANILIDAMKTHSKNEVQNNAIQRDYIEGFITALPSNGSNIYTVMINNEEYQVPTRDGLVLNVHDIVIIALFNGDFNKKWIDLKRPW